MIYYAHKDAPQEDIAELLKEAKTGDRLVLTFGPPIDGPPVSRLYSKEFLISIVDGEAMLIDADAFREWSETPATVPWWKES